jgi:hypothetical protein
VTNQHRAMLRCTALCCTVFLKIRFFNNQHQAVLRLAGLYCALLSSAKVISSEGERRLRAMEGHAACSMFEKLSTARHSAAWQSSIKNIAQRGSAQRVPRITRDCCVFKQGVASHSAAQHGLFVPSLKYYTSELTKHSTAQYSAA